MNAKEIKSEKLPSSVYVVVVALIIDLLGFTVILPLQPSIFQHYGSDEKDTLYQWLQRKVQYFQQFIKAPDVFNQVLFGGFLGSMFSLLQFLTSPIIGALSDVYGRKPVLLLSVVGIGLSHAVWMMSGHFYIFVIARIIGGISKANVTISTAIITDLCSPKNRGKGMALIGIAFAVGFIVGPMIGAVFAARAHGYNFYVMPAAFALAMSVLDLVLLLLCYKESLMPEHRAKSVGHGISKAISYINPVSLFSFKPVQNVSSKELGTMKLIGITYFIFLFIYSGLEYSLCFLTHNRFMFSSMQQGKMFLFSGIVMIVIQGGVVRRIPAGKEIKIALLGAIIVIPAFIIIGLSRSLSWLHVGLALYAFASATVVPCLTTIVSKLGSSDQKGTVLGVFRSLGSLARSFGPCVFAFAYWSLGSTITYCIGGALLVIPLLLIMRLKSRLLKAELIKGKSD